jgi:hypothetical protein
MGVGAGSGGDEFAGQRAERFGYLDGPVAESYPHAVVGDLHMAEGEPADVGGVLGVENHEQPGDAVGQVDGVVMQASRRSCWGLGADARTASSIR